MSEAAEMQSSRDKSSRDKSSRDVTRGNQAIKRVLSGSLIKHKGKGWGFIKCIK